MIAQYRNGIHSAGAELFQSGTGRIVSSQHTAALKNVGQGSPMERAPWPGVAGETELGLLARYCCGGGGGVPRMNWRICSRRLGAGSCTV